jgi:hypothetical protein
MFSDTLSSKICTSLNTCRPKTNSNRMFLLGIRYYLLDMLLRGVQKFSFKNESLSAVEQLVTKGRTQQYSHS